MNTILSSQWRYKIQIKHLFEDETTPELIITLCQSLVEQLKSIKSKVEKSKDIKSDVYFLLDEIEMHQDNFEFLQKLASGAISKNEWKNYGFNGDFEEEFNNYLTGLYDLGDERIQISNGGLEKFIWIG